MDFCRISGKRSGLFPVRLGHAAQLPAEGSNASSCGSNGALVMSKWISRSIHSRSSRTVTASAFWSFRYGCRRPVTREALREGASLVARLEPCNFKRVRDRQLCGIEGLLNFVHELGQTQASIDVLFRATDFFGERFDGIGIRLQLHEGGVAPRLVEFVHVGALQVLDKLQFEAFRVGEFADARRNGFPFRDSRSAVTPRTRYECKEAVLAAGQRTEENGLQDAVLADVAREFRQFRFVEGSSWICFRLLNTVEGDVLN